MWGFVRHQVPVLTLPQGPVSERHAIKLPDTLFQLRLGSMPLITYLDKLYQAGFEVMCFNASLAPYSAC